MSEQLAIGIDIGGTKIAGGLVDGTGIIQQQQALPTPGSAAAVVATVVQLCRDLQRSAPAVSGIGVGTLGQVDPVRGVIAYAVSTLAEWSGTPLAQRLQQHFDLPIYVDNDVNVMALAEHHFGAGRGFGSGLYVTVGTGVGGALILNGALHHGRHFAAGEIGHVLVDWRRERVCTCGGRGHLEVYASGPAMARSYNERQGTQYSLREISALAETGDTAANEVIMQGALLCGHTLAGLLNTVDPEVLVVGGGVPEMGDRWWQPFEAALRACPMPAPQSVMLRQAVLGNAAAIVGAASLVLRRRANGRNEGNGGLLASP